MKQVSAIKSKTRRPYVKAKIFDNSFKLLYDTGSDITALEYNQYLRIKPLPTLKEVNKQSSFQAAGGHDLLVMGTTKLPIFIDGRETVHKFVIIKNLNEPGLIGNDFIEEKWFKYDPDIRTGVIKNHIGQQPW